MQRTNVGPRGWAILVLMGGAFFASAFSRRGPLTPDASPIKSHSTASSNSTRSPEVEREQLNAQIAAQLVANELPSTPVDPRAQVRSLPQWAKPASELDQLIRQGPPNASSSPDFGSLVPLETWRDAQPTPHASHPNQPSALAYRESPWDSSGNTVVEQSDTSNQYAGAANGPHIQAWPTPDPDRNWNVNHRPQSSGARATGTTQPRSSRGSATSVDSIGSLVGSAREQPRQTPLVPQKPSPTHQQLPSVKPQDPRRFVYQPGYIGGS